MSSSSDFNNDSEPITLSSKIKFYSTIILKKILIYTIVLIIIYYTEKLLYKILSYILYFSFLSILFQIILHLLLLRYLVLKVAFAGLSFFISRNIQYKRGIMQASYILKELDILKSSFSLLFDESKPVEEIKHFNIIQRNVKNSIFIIKKYWQIFHKMKEKFNSLTLDQNIFYENILNLKTLLDESKLLKFLNDVITKLKEEKVYEINSLNKKERDEIIERRNSIKKIIETNVNNIIDNLVTQLNDYIGEKYSVCSTRYIRNYFKNLLFASLQQFDVGLDSFFHFEQKILFTKDGKAKLDYTIIKNKLGITQKEKKLMIMCGPNAEPYQIFSRNIPLNIYLNKGIDVLCWNYRGYGFSTGKANFNNLREDILTIYQEIKNNYDYKKIGVHGISIGGIPACYLAGKEKDIKLLVSDRNFGQIENIAKSSAYGKYLVFLYKLLLIPSSRNVENYLNATCEKIILNDPCDEIVSEEGSLKTMISEKICNEYIYLKQNLDNKMIEMKDIDTLESTDSTINTTNSSYNDNQIEIEDDEDNNLKNIDDISLKNNNQSNYNLIHQNSQSLDIVNNENISTRKKNITMLDILLSSKKDEFISNIIKISKFLNSSEENEILEQNIKEYINTQIFDIFTNIRSAGDTLYRITKINDNKYNQNLFIENFFNNLFVWGTYDKLDDYGSIYNSTEFISNMLETNIALINSFLNSETTNNFKNLEIIKNINIFYDYLSTIRKRMKWLVIKIGNKIIYLNEGEKYENELIKLGKGYLVSLNCGHNGLLSEEENIVFKYYLNKSELFFSDKTKNEYDDNNGNIFNEENNEIEDLDTSFSGLTKSIDDV